MEKSQREKVLEALDKDFERVKESLVKYASWLLQKCGNNSTARALLGEDLVAEAIQKLLENGHKWNDEKDLEGNVRWSIFSIAGNLSKKKDRIPTSNTPIEEHINLQADETESEIVAYIAAVKQKILDLLEEDEDATVVFQWRIVEGLKRNEICEGFEISIKNYESAKKRVLTAINKAQRLIKD